MRLKSTIAAIALAGVSVASQASSFSFDGASDLTFSFTVGVESSIDAAVTSSVVSGYGFDITSVVFDGTTLFDASSVSSGPVTAEFYTFSAASLAPGMYSIAVSGDALGSSYHGNVVLTPVPEPETLALMLAGLGVGGFLLGRRRFD